MKKVIISTMLAVSALLIISTSAYAAWSRPDTYREIASESLLFIDYSQTYNIANTPDRFYEHNPILGRHPSIGRVNLYFISSMILHPIISYILPSKVRPYFQYITIGIETSCIANNMRVGIGMRF